MQRIKGTKGVTSRKSVATKSIAKQSDSASQIFSSKDGNESPSKRFEKNKAFLKNLLPEYK